MVYKAQILTVFFFNECFIWVFLFYIFGYWKKYIYILSNKKKSNMNIMNIIYFKYIKKSNNVNFQKYFLSTFMTSSLGKNDYFYIYLES